MIRLRVESVIKGGLGLARDADGVVLVEGALPGEMVEARREGRSGGTRQASTTRILEPSPDRREAPCSAYGRCGGCDLQHARYDAQLAIKRSILEDCLRRVGKLESWPPPTVVPSPELGYRRRARLQVAHVGGVSRLGYYRRRSRDVEAIDGCPLLTTGISAVVEELARAPPSFLDHVVEMTLLEARGTFSALVRAEPELGQRELRAYLEARGCEELRVAAPGVEPAPSADGVTIDVAGTPVVASARAFFQGNAPLLEALLKAVAGSLPDRIGHLWDLFAGVGLFGTLLGARCRRVTCVEADPQAIPLLRRNLGRRSSRVVFEGTEVELLRRHPEPPDVAVVDPPRAGLPRQARELLTRAAIGHIVMVGCDAATFALDVGHLCGAGYRMRSLTLLDLYPQSAHVEAVAHLER